MKAAPLAIPEAVLNQHVIALGKTGAGKSSVLRHLVENRISSGKRVCVIDPKGDWWGLPSSASGDGPGFPVLLFGDYKSDRSDVPMDARAGKEVAQIVASSDQACALGFRGWMPADITRFWLDFAPGLFNANRGELYLVIDEVHNFAPKGKILSPQSGEMLHWTNRLASEGRGLGLKLLMASQRPQKVHNDTLTCCETLIAMRVVHPADRAALKEWMDECGEPAKGKDVLADVASMERGQAWVWFPDGKYLEKVKFPMFKSFDSFSEHATEAPTKWAKVDVDAVKQKLARVVKEKEDNDPRKLRAEIAVWKETVENLKKIQSVKVSEEDLREKYGTTKEVPILTPADRKLLEDLMAQLNELGVSHARLKDLIDLSQTAHGTLNKIFAALDNPKPERIAPRAPVPERPRKPLPAYAANGSSTLQVSDGAIPKGEKLILIAAAQHADGITREQATILTGFKRSTRDAYIQRLLAREYVFINTDSTIGATPQGREALGSDYEPLPTGRRLYEYWMCRLPSGEARVLETVYGPNGATRDDISQHTGFKRSTRDAYIQRLMTRKLVYASGTTIYPSPHVH